MSERHELAKQSGKLPLTWDNAGAAENSGDSASETERKKPATVKDVPQYDPDAEALSLTYTIPTWVNSIERIFTGCDFSQISFNARYKLRKELTSLICSAETLIDITRKNER
jgi:hypothetical protein